ncbi:AAL025Wp [Eremothecium gossypii ATCC 10895]|uniref:AAL025Wp n=1 Tax=Eremothecium gossypii (strain ATCC 10895 / CBS 109.51 / FGSC 9923 / NRRL Y-1056) TaxID=284811 RepID=Q75F83_EREGS|nr:AAL025Wp [Eremothecium gossypii ATCC 10895]AAS50341.1 AAL025Wp [Eremothecium gossypii ATCC 10895]AEY94627.1 FAAL025Wp [Eremothecium gossypii FDAG1]
MRLLELGLVFGGLLGSVRCMPHGDKIHTEVERPPEGKNWEQWHMEHEHQMAEYTPEKFFNLHDTNGKGYMDERDILSLYGLSRPEVVGTGDGMGQHDDSERIDEETANRIVKLIGELLDTNDDGKVTKAEYLNFAKRGKSFPDLGVGVGHHLDFEKEFNVHHWNTHHQNNEKTTHREDVEHDLLHYYHSLEQDELKRGATRGSYVTDDQLESQIMKQKIPSKYLTGRL